MYSPQSATLSAVLHQQIHPANTTNITNSWHFHSQGLFHHYHLSCQPCKNYQVTLSLLEGSTTSSIITTTWSVLPTLPTVKLSLLTNAFIIVTTLTNPTKSYFLSVNDLFANHQPYQHYQRILPLPPPSPRSQALPNHVPIIQQVITPCFMVRTNNLFGNKTDQMSQFQTVCGVRRADLIRKLITQSTLPHATLSSLPFFRFFFFSSVDDYCNAFLSPLFMSYICSVVILVMETIYSYYCLHYC